METSENGETEIRRVTAELEKIKTDLLRLHKTLIESERIEYERAFGTIDSPNQFLKLLISDPWFAWLKPLSNLAVSIDQLVQSDEPLNNSNLLAILETSKGLLRASEEGEGFERSYFEALQRSPDVILAHAEVWKRLREG